MSDIKHGSDNDLLYLFLKWGNISLKHYMFHMYNSIFLLL